VPEIPENVKEEKEEILKEEIKLEEIPIEKESEINENKEEKVSKPSTSVIQKQPTQSLLSASFKDIPPPPPSLPKDSSH